jgi:hypothetical protein
MLKTNKNSPNSDSRCWGVRLRNMGRQTSGSSSFLSDVSLQQLDFEKDWKLITVFFSNTSQCHLCPSAQQVSCRWGG